MNNLFKILGILIVFSSALSAQEEPPGKDTVSTGEILVESNRIKMSKMLAPNKINVLDKKILSSVNGSKLSDALSFTNPVFIKDYGFNSGLKTIALNSTQSEQTLIMLDGVKLNNKQHEQVDFVLFNLDEVERIEISEGGSSSLYGSEAIGGVINIVTKRSSLNHPFSVKLKSDFGSYGLRKFYGNFAHEIKKDKNRFISYGVSYSDERAKNNYEFHFFNGFNRVIKEKQLSDYNTQTFNFDLDLILNNKTDLKVITLYNHFDRGAPGIELGYSSSTARQIDYNLISSAVLNRALGKDLSCRGSLNYAYSLMKYYDTATYNLSTPINSFYKLFSYSNTGNFSYSPRKNYGIDFGYEAGYYNIKSNDTEDGHLLQLGLYSAGKYEWNNILFSKITVYPSVRYDYYSNIENKNVVTGKLGLNIKILDDADLTIKSTIGNNFRVPTFNMLYWKDLGNKNLKPERSVNFDAGLYYGFDLIAQNTIEFSYHHINTTNRLLWRPGSDNIWRPVNVGEVISEGIDLSVNSKIEIAKRISVTGTVGYNYGSAIKKSEDFPGDPSYNKQLIYIPKEMFKSSIMINYLTSSKLIKFVSFNAFYTFTGKRFVNFENTVFVPYYELIDANITAGLKAFESELSLKFSVNNLLNEDYQVVSGYPMPLRNYRFEISFKY